MTQSLLSLFCRNNVLSYLHLLFKDCLSRSLCSHRFGTSFALLRYLLEVSSEIAQPENSQVSFMLSCRCSIQRGNSILLGRNFLFPYVKIRRKNVASQKETFSMLHCTLAKNHERYLKIIKCHLKRIEFRTGKSCGAETSEKYKRVKGCLKTPLAIELSRLFSNDINKSVKDDYSILLYKSETVEFERNLLTLFRALSPTHFLTFLSKHRKYVQQHSFSVLLIFTNSKNFSRSKVILV